MADIDGGRGPGEDAERRRREEQAAEVRREARDRETRERAEETRRDERAQDRRIGPNEQHGRDQVLEHRGLEPNNSLDRVSRTMENQGSPLAHRTRDDMSPEQRAAMDRRHVETLDRRSEQHRSDVVRELADKEGPEGHDASARDAEESFGDGRSDGEARTRGAPEDRGDERGRDRDRTADLGREQQAERDLERAHDGEDDPAIAAALSRAREDGRELESEARRDPLKDSEVEKWAATAEERHERTKNDKEKDTAREGGNRGRDAERDDAAPGR